MSKENLSHPTPNKLVPLDEDICYDFFMATKPHMGIQHGESREVVYRQLAKAICSTFGVPEKQPSITKIVDDN